LEIGALICFPLVWSVAMWRAAPAIGTWPTLMLIGAVSGLLAADFVSGFFHWLFDTWGSPEVPFIGPTLIRTFREHHVDQLAITRHDFVETNGTNVMFAILPSGGALLFRNPTGTKTDAFFATMLCFMAAFTAMTSQVHKWAHMAKPPRFVTLLQRTRILLAPDHHAHHHTAPYIKHYCINCGWMNAPLASIRFFPTLERIITAVTGALPRKDDIGAEAAVVVLEVLETEESEIAQCDRDVVLAPACERVVDENLAQSSRRGVVAGRTHRVRD
jgi:TMEM189-like protein